MRNRTKAREIAIQALFQMEMRGPDIERELQSFYREQAITSDVMDFAAMLIKGCWSKTKEIDEKIIDISANWDLHRMPVMDKCILRLSVYELLYEKDIPPKVSINEAIELAKKFSTENSATFVNGILDKIYTKCCKEKTG